MKAITICQPWAHAIVHGGKRVENRCWSTSYRGPLLIHAGRSREWFLSLGLVFPDGSEVPSASSCVYGAIIGQARLVACVRKADPRVASDPWAEGPWCWILDDVQAFADPLFVAGQRMLWDYDMEATP